MNITEAETLALLHMEEHGILNKFKFFFEDCKRSLGRCHYYDRKITLSKWYVELNEERDVEDTILHEIAHALAWIRYGSKGQGHGRLWKSVCIEIGAKPERLNQGILEYPDNHYKYSVTCCNTTYGKHRMGKNRSYGCPKCKKRLKFAKNY
jgi:predicted SprT family Zn-dependent metalloprotease